MKRTKLLLFAIVAGLLMSLAPVLVFADTTQTFSLSQSTYLLQYVMPAGTVFNGSISTTGSVRFWASDPNMTEIVNLGIVDNSATFSFVAAQNGTYTLNFENDMPNTIQVTFSYISNPTIADANSSNGTFLTYILITIIIAVVGSILIIFLVRRANKQISTDIGAAKASNGQRSV